MAYIVPVESSYEEIRKTHRRPRIKVGYLWVKDRLYYLYARKGTVKVRDTVELRKELSCYPVSGVPEVSVEGVPWRNWWLEGRDIVVRLENLTEQDGYWSQLEYDDSYWGFFKSAMEYLPDNEVCVKYSCLNWNSEPYPSGQMFEAVDATGCFRIYEADSQKHIMPSGYVENEPVVITDHTKIPSDARDYQLQFRITQPSREIEFNKHDNKVRNPHFARGLYGSGAVPASWYAPNPTGALRTLGSGYVGEYFMRVQPTGMVLQDIEVSSQPLTLEMWTRGGIPRLELAFKRSGPPETIIDLDGNVIGTDPNFSVSSHCIEGQMAEWPDWAHTSVVIGEGTEFEPADIQLPECDLLEVRLVAASGQVDFGAVQLSDARRAGQYNYVDPNATVEYEKSREGFYRHYPRDIYPYEDLWDADLNPVNDESYEGFLIINEEGEPTDTILEIGELVFEEPGDYGSLCVPSGNWPDCSGYPQGIVPWPTGVRHIFGRRNLPYAKIHGYQKLRQTQTFDLYNQPESLVEVTEPVQDILPKDILLLSPASMYRDGNRKPWLVLRESTGRHEMVGAILLDNNGNGIIGEWVDVVPTGCSPSGALYVDPSGGYTNHGGRVMFDVWSSGCAPGRGSLTFRHKASGISGMLGLEIGS